MVDLRLWLAAVKDYILYHDLLLTLAVDLAFFLFCVLCYFVNRWWKARRLRDGALLEASTALLAEAEGGSPRRRQEQAMNSTVQNYLKFLETGIWLFVVLSAISIPLTMREWGAAILLNGDRVRSIGRILYSDPGGCREGFPTFAGSQAMECLPNSNGHWVLQRRGNAVRVHPQLKPKANATTAELQFADTFADLHFADCRDLASVCAAPSFAYSAKLQECWFFGSAVPANVSRRGDFRFCQGHQDFSPGVIEFGMTLGYGAITLVFAGLLLRHVLRSSDHGKLMSHAIWLTEIPVKDVEDHEPFTLDKEAFHRVSRELAAAVTSEINKQVVEKDLGHWFLDEEKVAQMYVVHVHGAEERLAGHAFATMSREAYASMLLMRKKPMFGLSCLSFLPSYVHWRSHTLLKFGVPPWSAVTLRCQRAPPASDIIWTNLHIRYRWLLSWALQLLLFAFMLAVAAPVSLSSTIFEIIDTLHKNEAVGHVLPPKFWLLVQRTVMNLPSYIILGMNSVLLPSAIALISDARRPHLKSRAESLQFQTNLWFLVLNSLIFPLLGFLTRDKSLWDQAISYFSQFKGEEATEAFYSVGLQSLRAPSVLILKYLMNAALITSGTQLIQLGKGIARRCMCLPDQPWEFAWGYWYAWSMSTLVLALSMSVIVPAAVPFAALYFAVTYVVHRGNLRTGVFQISFAMDRQCEISIVYYVFKAVSLFWVVMALFFAAQAGGPGESTLNLKTPYLMHVKEEDLVPRLPIKIPYSVVAVWVLSFLAFLSFAASRLLGENGSLERRVWRQFGEKGQGRLHDLCSLLTLVFLAGAWHVKPEIGWTPVAVRLHTAAAYSLVVLAFVNMLVVAAMQWLVKRIIRGTTMSDIDFKTLQASRKIAREDMQREVAELFSGQSAASLEPANAPVSDMYLPLSRQGSIQVQVTDLAR